MKWLEIINVRCAGQVNEVYSQIDLKQALHRTGKETGLKRIRIYRHASLSRDISIHLFYESSELQVNKSELGLRLTASLKELGLVSHSLWMLEDDQQKSSEMVRSNKQAGVPSSQKRTSSV